METKPSRPYRMGLDEPRHREILQTGRESHERYADALAECLDMERGSSKELTGKEHLERADFILAKQKQEAEQVKAEKEVAEADRDAAIRETDNAKSEHENSRSGTRRSSGAARNLTAKSPKGGTCERG